MSARRVPVPATFFVVVVAVICLIIFFGAWAVSAGADDRGGSLSFGFAGGGASLEPRVLNNSQGAGVGALDQGEGSSDSWWGKAFSKACPLH